MSKQTELFERSKQLVPGGVHSPVRSFKGLPITPRFVKEASGAYFQDVEGKDYIDFCMSFGPLILGHKNTEVEKDLIEALGRGWSYGACEPYSLELAEFLIENLSHVEQLRFVNSGTEAVMTALRLARGATGRNKIIKFDGCYHGHVDSMLIKAGSGLAGEAEASSAGVPEGVAKDTLILDLGDKEGVIQCFKDHPGEIAAIIIEPLPANNGLLVQTIEFLTFLREITAEHGSLLIFDEVISGFRVAFGGMCEVTGIVPDITTYGKIIGGGLPVGAIASTNDIMKNLAPLGNVYQAGTLSANPLAMVGGLSTLKKLNEETYHNLEKAGQKLEEIFNEWFVGYNDGEFKDYHMTRYGSLFWILPGGKDIHRVGEIPLNLAGRFNKLFPLLLEKGIYLSPNAYEVGFLSQAHNDFVLEDLKKRLWS
ncbi:putative glutamate-1-semialdehyde-2,1-aminomutase [Bacteriovorax sp. BSW11_IV]|uniref:glutamate-1-semialdehyde 2,1-aminomutase n=1 Tax=Bacteriovorax sp. BSW11_IV TaxID=1353529 RepID=UPI000389DD85|nr:glutamate-1-semialdehyde 2,1-aminomutase [Bacteriovorax sp. BSW11_IV]EQC47869.1 putative glutamate-1-semialdehyde-2,1-aminomutase [Bacteriovorax sp. BSW11_IV]